MDVGITALKKKGLRPRTQSQSPMVPVGITALKKKGLRLDCDTLLACCYAVGITALKKKGLRLGDTVRW